MKILTKNQIYQRITGRNIRKNRRRKINIIKTNPLIFWKPYNTLGSRLEKD